MRNSIKSTNMARLVGVIIFAGTFSALSFAKGNFDGNEHGQGRKNQSQPLTSEQSHRAESIASNTCSSCHGASLEGKIGPSLQLVGQRYSVEKIEKIIRMGKGKKKQLSMPPGLVSDADAALLARWLVQRSTFKNAVEK